MKAEDMCNCSLAAATRPRKPDICTTKQFYHCFMGHLFPDNHSTIEESCKAKCKAPCSYWQYQKSVSYATFPAQTAKYFVANQSEWEELKSTIVLEMYFSVLDYTTIKHVIAMPFQSVIAQIGGQFSLWAGASLISFVQIVIYTIMCCCKRCSKRCRGRKLHRLRAQRCEIPAENGTTPDYSTTEKETDDRIL